MGLSQMPPSLLQRLFGAYDFRFYPSEENMWQFGVLAAGITALFFTTRGAVRIAFAAADLASQLVTCRGRRASNASAMPFAFAKTEFWDAFYTIRARTFADSGGSGSDPEVDAALDARDLTFVAAVEARLGEKRSEGQATEESGVEQGGGDNDEDDDDGSGSGNSGDDSGGAACNISHQSWAIAGDSEPFEWYVPSAQLLPALRGPSQPFH